MRAARALGCERWGFVVASALKVPSLAAASRTLRPRRVWLSLIVLFRALTVLFALQFSGVIHGVSDVTHAVLLQAEAEHEHCPPDRPCDDCPPGCPNCHCGVIGSLAPESPLALVSRLPSGPRSRRIEGARAPAGPELPSLFRPPRV